MTVILRRDSLGALWLLLILFFCTRVARGGGQQRNPASSSLLVTNEGFLQCITDQNCGLVNKCSFKLYSTTSTGSSGNLTVVSGHLMALKNHMPFGIVFYWDVLGYESPPGEDPNRRYNGIYSPANTIKYFDTKHYGAHTIRLYISNTLPSTGVNSMPLYADGNFPPPDPRTLENVQTVISSGDECTRNQACRLLDTVCYMASNSNMDCQKYQTVCNNFNDADQIAKDSCIPECIYTYYSDVIPNFEEIDPNLVVKWLALGGGTVGSEVDGLYNTGPVIGIAIALIMSLLINFTLTCLACRYRHSLKAMDLSSPPQSSAEIIGTADFGYV